MTLEKTSSGQSPFGVFYIILLLNYFARTHSIALPVVVYSHRTGAVWTDGRQMMFLDLLYLIAAI